MTDTWYDRELLLGFFFGVWCTERMTETLYRVFERVCTALKLQLVVFFHLQFFDKILNWITEFYFVPILIIEYLRNNPISDGNSGKIDKNIKKIREWILKRHCSDTFYGLNSRRFFCVMLVRSSKEKLNRRNWQWADPTNAT